MEELLDLNVLMLVQGCALTVPGRLRQPTFGLGRLKKNTGRPVSSLFLVDRECSLHKNIPFYKITKIVHML